MIDEAKQALSYYDGMMSADVRPLDGGLINHTFLVTLPNSTRYILQRVHPVFGPDVHFDIDAVTRHLQMKQMTTPLLLKTKQDRLWVSELGERPWRVMTFVAGDTFNQVAGSKMAFEAGALVARFHSALADFTYEFKFTRKGAHDTAAHFAKLQGALASHAHVPMYAEIAACGRAILQDAVLALDFSTLKTRVAHGDLKISNLLFAPDGRGVALVDLDTCAKLPLAVELGDALRSWCNAAAEDTTQTAFDLSVFGAAMQGYRSVAKELAADELATVVPGLMTICLELAARFCADALLDEYFGWNPAKFASRREHNLVRAKGQLQLFKSVLAQRADAISLLEQA